MNNKRWKVRDTEDISSVRLLADSLNVSDILASLLIQRDIKNFNEAKLFFRASLDVLHDPFLMDGMENATYRIIKAITENQNICIYGDYDVDGTCSTAVLYLFLKELGANVEFYIPKRLTEGYGLNKSGIDHIKSRNIALLISVDCGITAVEETEYANTLGIDVIICDHHQPKDIIPNAYAVLDPLKPSCNYPFPYLSGAGVAFKLAQGVSERIGKRELPMQYLDLVAMAGAADIVPLIDENRILVKEGLRLINTKPRPGVAALIDLSNIQPGELTTGQIVFTMAPRINAVGRLGDAERAVELLITESKDEAFKLAQVLESENYTRRKIDEDTYFSALEKIEATLDLTTENAIILHQESWHPGVIGIVASRLVEKYYRPTIMLTTVDGVAKGSARSISNFNIYDALKKCEDLLIHFGGHQAAAGLAVEVDKLDEFRTKFNRIVKETITDDNLLPEILIDCKLNFSDITPKFTRILEQFSPFGPGNMRPMFLSENVAPAGMARIVGSNHLVMLLKQKGSEKVFDSIAFNMGHMCDEINKPSNKIDVVYSIDRTVRDGRVFPQFRVKDIKIKNADNII